jgi:polyhydroxybutyrate depolymerase
VPAAPAGLTRAGVIRSAMRRTIAVLVGLWGAACADPTTATSEEGGSSSTASSSAGAGSSGEPTSTAGTTSTATSDATGADSSSSGETGGVSPGCGAPGAGPGKHQNLALDVDGTARSYDLFVPSGYDPDVAAPLVLNFHGLLGWPVQQAEFSGFDASAEPRGMLVAYPAGIGSSFNSGACCGDAYAQDVDDVGFARALVDEVSRTYCVDPRRVFVTGMSNGGHMAHLLACVAADVFAAGASVTGVLQLAPADCTPARPISMLDFHGNSDLIVPYGGGGPGYPPVPDMMSAWAARDGCAAASGVVFEQDDMRCETWPACQDDVEVTLCTIDGGGHCWPGPGDCPFGHNSSARVASDVIADMFMAHPMP